LSFSTTLGTLYNEYHNFKYFGHYSDFEVDNMLVWEREVKMGILTKQLKKEGKIK